MNGAHSWQTQTPFSPTTTHVYHFFIWGRTTGGLGPKSPAWIVLPDRVPLHSDNRHVIGLHLRLSTPAARAAEWLHYASDGPDERVNGKSVNECVKIFTADLGRTRPEDCKPLRSCVKSRLIVSPRIVTCDKNVFS